MKFFNTEGSNTMQTTLRILALSAFIGAVFSFSGCAETQVRNSESNEKAFKIANAQVVWRDNPGLNLRVAKMMRSYGGTTGPITVSDYERKKINERIEPVLAGFKAEFQRKMIRSLSDHGVANGRDYMLLATPIEAIYPVDIGGEQGFAWSIGIALVRLDEIRPMWRAQISLQGNLLTKPEDLQVNLVKAVVSELSRAGWMQ